MWLSWQVQAHRASKHGRPPGEKLPGFALERMDRSITLSGQSIHRGVIVPDGIAAFGVVVAGCEQAQPGGGGHLTQ